MSATGTSLPVHTRYTAVRICLILSMVVVPIVIAVFGCSRDNRVPLDEFLQMQRKTARPVAARPDMYPDDSESPTTQPAAMPGMQPAPQTQPAADSYWTPYKIGPGDILGVAMTGIDQSGAITPIMARVNRNGQVDLPLIGKVQVAGMELQDAEEAIQNRYVPDFYRQASIHLELAKPETVGVLVTGAVSQPGLIQLPRTQRNLLHAIAGAGGATNLANGEVLLRRLRTGEEVTYNLLLPEQLQVALTRAPLENGDVVIVQAAQPNTIFIGGLVMSPHAQNNPPGTRMNVLQALASAGGIRTDVTPTEITLIRRMPDGQDVHVKLDVDRIQHGKEPNIELAAGDILWVPETMLTRTQSWINQNIFIRAGATAVVSYDATGISFLNNNAEQSILGVTNNNLENRFDPFGFLVRQQQLNNIQNQLPRALP